MIGDPLVGTADFKPSEYLKESTGGDVPAAYRRNAQTTLVVLQRIRDALGVPVIITDGWRSPAANASTAGSSKTSPHMTALGVDFDVPSLTKREVGERLDATDAQLRPYDQIIYYLTDDHYHLTVGGSSRGQRLVKTTETEYEIYAGADTLPDAHTPRGSGIWKLVAGVVVFCLAARFLRGL